MQSKQINLMLLSIIMLHISVVIVLSTVGIDWDMTIVHNMILSEAIIVVPAVGFLVSSGKVTNLAEELGFRKIKWSTALMVGVFTVLMIPLTILVNAISMLFVDNAVASMSDEMLQLPSWLILFFLAVSAPLSEEFVFRGIVYRGCSRASNKWSAMWISALFFGLMHMNFNQAAYAIVLGIALALLMEATGSLWGTLLFHGIFNGISGIEMLLVNHFMPEIYNEETMVMVNEGNEMQMVIGVYLLIALVTTSIAGCVLAWIAKNENRVEEVREIWTGRHEKKEKAVTVSLIAAAVFAIGFMIFELVAPRLF